MLRAAGKYRQAFLLGLQGSLVYRWNFAVRGFFSLFHLAAVFILWGAAFAGRDQVGGFDLRQTLTYFTTILFLQFLISAFNEDYQISEEIRMGLINQFLLKPINYFLYRLSIFAAARLVSGALILLPLAAAYPFIHDTLVFPGEPWRLAAAVPALVLSALVQFTIAYCFGLMTFWFLEIQGLVVLSDINGAMLAHGRNRLIDAGLLRGVAYAQANAERLPFADASFDCVTIGFGLRNVTDKAAALASMRRVLRPGGQLLVLEFSQPVAPGLKPLYDAYSFRVLPVLGKVVAQDEGSYRYLAESIRKHPDQETLLGMMRDAGLEDCRYHNLAGGIVALHRGYRY